MGRGLAIWPQWRGRGFACRSSPPNQFHLGDALVAGLPPIVFVDTGPLDYWQTDCAHMVVVVGIDTSVSLNDPFFDAAPQQTSLASFLQAWALNEHLAVILRPRP